MKNKENATDVLEVFPGTKGGNISGIVTSNDFEQYSREISTFVPNDDYFVKYFENLFEGVSEDIEITLTKKNMMHQLGLFRQRLISLSN